MEIIELELPEEASGALFAGPDNSWIVVRSDLGSDEKARRIRSLLMALLVRTADAPLRQKRAWITEGDLAKFYAGTQWEPMNGWRPDEEVIEALRSFVTDTLDGIAEDVPEAVYPLPDGVGAAIAFGYDETGRRRPLIWVDSRLSQALRADLWGYCAALIADGAKSEGHADADGLLFVGTERQPVTGTGPALLGALTVQRFGRRPGDCAFPLVGRPKDMQ
ncbi:hypothetical protein [Streptomyces sp. NPDC055005]